MLSFVTYILIPSLVVQLFYTKLQLYRLKLVSLQTKMSHNSLPRKKNKKNITTEIRMESLLNQRFPMAPNPHALKKLNIFLTTVSRPHVIYRLKKKTRV